MKDKKYKITGRLVGGYRNPEGDIVNVEHTKYARFNWTLSLKLLYMQLFYDHVELEVLK